MSTHIESEWWSRWNRGRENWNKNTFIHTWTSALIGPYKLFYLHAEKCLHEYSTTICVGSEIKPFDLDCLCFDSASFALALPLSTTLIYSHLNIQMTMKLVQYMDSIAINKPKKRVCECVGVYVYIVSSMTQWVYSEIASNLKKISKNESKIQQSDT